ncbi:MAG TPA: redoxin domain-containing protein [Gaiellaceae bacterium]|nr:redoxin domain-containing protein [Gaiellaceae bacterium]
MSVGLRRAGQALAIAAVLALLAVLAWRVVEDSGGGASASLRRGDHPAAPDFDLERLDTDGRLKLSSLRGKVVVLNLWTSWCYPCIREAKVLEEGWQRWRDRGVVVVGVNAQDLVTDARRFMRRYGVTYPNVRDKSGDVLDAYGWTYFPETYFVGKDGTLVSAVLGEIDREQLEDGIREALAS